MTHPKISRSEIYVTNVTYTEPTDIVHNEADRDHGALIEESLLDIADPPEGSVEWSVGVQLEWRPGVGLVRKS
jgi:hypothetical protein